MISRWQLVLAAVIFGSWLFGASSPGVVAGDGPEHPAPEPLLAPSHASRVSASAGHQRARVLYPRLSPDGEKIAFTAAQRVWVMDIFDRRPRRLTDMDVVEMHPVWAPDRVAVAFVTWPEGPEGGHVWEAELGGEMGPRRLTEVPGYYAFPSYSLNGRRLVVLEAPRGTWREWNGRIDAGRGRGAETEPIGLQIQTIPSFGLSLGNPALEVGSVRAWGRPHLTTQRGRVFFYEPAAGLLSMRLDGSDRRSHLRAFSNDPAESAMRLPVDEVLMSPRGDRVLLRSGPSLYLMPLPQVGGEAIELSLSDPGAAPFPLTEVTDAADDAAFSTGGTAVIFASADHVTIYFIDSGEVVDVKVPDLGRNSRRSGLAAGPTA